MLLMGLQGCSVGFPVFSPGYKSCAACSAQCRMTLVSCTALLAVRRQSGYGRSLRLKSLGPMKGLVFL